LSADIFLEKCKSFNFSPQVGWKCEPAVLGENLLNMTSVTLVKVCLGGRTHVRTNFPCPEKVEWLPRQGKILKEQTKFVKKRLPVCMGP
jgi:hypothetical protein